MPHAGVLIYLFFFFFFFFFFYFIYCITYCCLSKRELSRKTAGSSSPVHQAYSERE